MSRPGGDGGAGPQPAQDGAQIDIAIGPSGGRVSISHSKPSLSRILRGKTTGEALSLIPLLLPVCGVAQSVAASRAIEAANGQPADAATERNRALAMLIERATAAAWRFTMDWPLLVDDQAQPANLKAVRDAASVARRAVGGPAATLDRALVALAAVLATLVPELDMNASRDAPPDDALARLLAGTSVPARALQRARRHHAPADDPHPVISKVLVTGPEAARECARAALMAEPFDSAAPAMVQPVDVGPVAFCADARIADAVTLLGYCPTTRLFAMVIEAAATAEALRTWFTAIERNTETALIGEGLTARGPVYHAVRLDGDVVEDWRILAPTDWHFAPDSAAATELRDAPQGRIDRGHAELVIASFDPCARVRLTVD